MKQFLEFSVNKTVIPTPSVVSSPVIKSNVTASRSLSASLPGFLRAPTTPHVGRPPTTVMTPEQIVEKAKQVTLNIYLTKIKSSFLFLLNPPL